ncbi:aspartyl-phosphate phosphatase Spo0E family protein [Paenibacillus ginsengarvi]|uniref:Aspartyl-phosphate phosphatase Spo0E family protein n=2 Tax=Paenibacillus ginsengarvi TaxID=400777 RepID=A0A3B0CTE3_9BACL|nr:aspartyl-phosphate phosphatase Spo0E family protein [Paenibacillus ginsengarvi]
MNQNFGLPAEIDQMKRLLERTAKKYRYNFRHPRVIEISQQLDKLIVNMMRRNR